MQGRIIRVQSEAYQYAHWQEIKTGVAKLGNPCTEPELTIGEL